MNSWLLVESAWVAIGVSLYCITAVMSLVDYRHGSLVEKIMPFTFLAGVLALAVAITLRWNQLGQGPFMTLYEILLSNLFSLGLIVLIIYLYSPIMRHGARAVLVFLSLLGIWLIYVSPAPVALPPSFDNPWLWVHVISGKIFLGTCLVAVGLAIQLLVKNTLGAINASGTANLLQQDSGLWRFMAVAFVFHSAMLLSGAVWARTAWGRYWSWDPLETWALITWLTLAVILHLRLTIKMPLWTGWLLVQIVFVLAFLTFFGMPFFSIAPHKGII